MSDDDLVIKLRADALSWRELGDDIVVLDLDRSVYLTVTGAGTVIWRGAIEGTTLPELVLALQQIYDVDDETARRDITAFVDDLRGRNLLQP